MWVGRERAEAITNVSRAFALARGVHVIDFAYQQTVAFLDAQAQGQLWGERFERHPARVDLVYSFVHTLIRTLTTRFAEMRRFFH